MLNLFFVVVCGMNVMGVALVHIIATALSAGIVNLWLIREKGEQTHAPGIRPQLIR